MNGHLEVAQWLLLNGGTCDAAILVNMRDDAKVALRTVTSQLSKDHSNFTRLVLPAISGLALPFGPRTVYQRGGFE